MDKIRIGTRGSRLALRQAALVQEAFAKVGVEIETEIVILHTKGDKVLDRPLSEVGDKGIFVSEFEQALLEGQIDLAVHSAKDLPMALAKGLTIAAVLKRADVRDVLIVPKGARVPQGTRSLCGAVIEEAKEQSQTAFVIGTGSRRRQIQAEQVWNSVVCQNIRGNVESRLLKLMANGYDGILLAKAGLDRLGISPLWQEQFSFYPLPPEQFLPAACQGIIAVETVQDSQAAALCQAIMDQETNLSFQVEREALNQLAADCSEPAAAWCRKEANRLVLDVMYAGNRKTLDCELGIQNGLEMAQKAARLVKPICGM